MTTQTTIKPGDIRKWTFEKGQLCRDEAIKDLDQAIELMKASV